MAKPSAANALSNPEDRLFTLKELAGYLGFTERTIYNWRSRKLGPRAFKIGATIRYRKSDVDEWLLANKEVVEEKAG